MVYPNDDSELEKKATLPEQKSPQYLQMLKAELERRKAMRPGYSLRAFAGDLELDPSALSKILKGFKYLSVRASLVIVKKIELSDRDKKLFLLSVAEEKSESICKRLEVEFQPPITLSTLRQFLSKPEPNVETMAEIS